MRISDWSSDVCSSDLLGLPPGATVWHSVLVHAADGVPLQVEDRYVNPDTAPGYLDADFETETPNEFLMRAAPATEVEHIVEAIMQIGRASCRERVCQYV